MPRKRVLREFRIDEISGVDRPAQEGAQVAIMKRADPEDGADDRMLKCVTAAIAMTGEAEDHQHGIGLDSEGNYSGLYVGYGYLTDGTEHFHPITRSPLAIGMSAGHTHDVDAAAIASVVMEKGDVDMAEQTTKQDEQPTMEAIQAQLARASAVIALSNEERAHFDALPEEARTEFLSKSASERKSEIVAVTKAAQDADPVEYTTADGVALRKSEGEAFIAMAKSNDAIRRENDALRKQREQDALEKRAQDELAHLPGDLKTRAAMLKAIDGIDDEAQREAAQNALRAQNEAISKAFETHGHGGQPEPGSSDDRLDKLAKAHAKEHGVSEAVAYAEVLGSEEGSALYAQTVS